MIWRKQLFDAKSGRGRRYVETILAVVATCHGHSRNSFESIDAPFQAHFAGHRVPSLLTGVWVLGFLPAVLPCWTGCERPLFPHATVPTSSVSCFSTKPWGMRSCSIRRFSAEHS